MSTRSENRRGRGRVAVILYRREIQLARFFCTRKMGLTRVNARAKKKGEGARRHSKNAHGLGGFERRDACVARGTRSRGVSRVAMWSLDPERDFFFGPKECLCTGRRRRCVFMTPIEDKNRRRRHRFVSIRRRGFLMLTMYCSFSFSFNRPFKI